jgi:hypothetical protein
MREIQELTMQAVSEATRIEATIANRREKFAGGVREWMDAQNSADHMVGGGGFQVLNLEGM